MHVLRPYQRRALVFTMRTKHPALCLAPRLGKCLVTIRRVKAYSDSHLILIVCPNPAVLGWCVELEREKEGQPYLLTQRTRKQRLKALRTGLGQEVQRRAWFLINKDGWRALPEIKDVAWDVLIIDEKIISDPTTKITNFFLTHFRGVKHRWQLSGKLAPEGDTQYITALWFLDPAIWGQRPPWKKRNYYQIQDKFFQPSRWNSHEWHLRDNMKATWHRILAKNCYFLDRRDVKLGGIVVPEVRTVEFPDNLRKAYMKVVKEFRLEVDGKELARTIYAPSKHTLLRRLCGGYVPGMQPWTGKVDELCNMLTTEFKGQQAIIWAVFTEELDALEAALSPLGRVARVDGTVPPGPRRRALEQAFQAKERDWFLAHPACYQYGADLSAAKLMVYYSSPESADMREQSSQRFVNLTHTHNLLLIDLVVNDTVDEDIVTSHLLKESGELQSRRIAKRLRAQWEER